MKAAFVPMSPLLFRHLSGRADPLASLRSAAVAAVREACAGAGSVTVLVPVAGREAPAAWWDPSGVVPGGRPLGEQVAEHLLELAGVTVELALVRIPADLAAVTTEHEAQLDGPLIVLGDGAAARRDGAPGYVDDRSFAYDDTVARALADGDADALADLDPVLGAELLATGRLTWPVAARLLRPPEQAELRYRDDPFGLSYFVALWA
jgi:hypothetical protein